MAKEIKIKNVNGITLKTKNKYVDDNIAVIIDSENLIAENIKSGISILGVTGTYEGESGSGSGSGGAGIVPAGTIDITANGTYDVTNYANANVNVANENDLLQKRFNEHNGYGLFAYFQGTSVDEYMNGLDLKGLNTCQYMYSGANKLTSINHLDAKDVTTMYNAFSSCSRIKHISISNTNKVQTMYGMCNGCNYLESISPLNTDSCDSFYNLFAVCRKLKIIDLSSLDKATNTSSTNKLAGNCNSLTKFIIRKMAKIPILNANAFENCYHFTGTVNATYNPDGLKDGRIYVPDNMVDSLKTATNWSTYADIIVPLSTLMEE